MTRLQAKDVLISLGIETPTEEQISNYLNSVNGETKKEKERAEAYKKEADKSAELQKALDDLNNANLTDIEKANKETKDALDKVANLEKKIAEMNTKNSLLANGLSEDEANKFIESLNSGSFDASIIGSIIAERQKTAVADFEKKALEGTPNPNGKGGSENLENEKTEADKLAESYAKSFTEASKSSADIVNAYI